MAEIKLLHGKVPCTEMRPPPIIRTLDRKWEGHAPGGLAGLFSDSCPPIIIMIRAIINFIMLYEITI